VIFPDEKAKHRLLLAGHGALAERRSGVGAEGDSRTRRPSLVDENMLVDVSVMSMVSTGATGRLVTSDEHTPAKSVSGVRYRWRTRSHCMIIKRSSRLILQHQNFRSGQRRNR